MKIGIAFDLKQPAPKTADASRRDDEDEEFDSPRTIDALAAAIRSFGHEVALLGDGRELVARLLADPPDFVFNYAEGLGVSRSREARVPALCEMLGIPFSGSDPLTMAVTLDKAMAKTIVSAAGVAVPEAVALGPGDAPPDLPPERFPLVVKPSWEGSSKGIRERSYVRSPRELSEALASLRSYGQTILLERYVPGAELTVGLAGNADPQVLGIMKVVPNVPGDHFIYSLETKRDYLNRVTYEVPAKLSPTAEAAVRRSALTAYRALGCRDVARVDFRLDGDVPYFLEVNPLPGLNPDDSDLVILARNLGWDYRRLVGTILDAALARVADRV